MADTAEVFIKVKAPYAKYFCFLTPSGCVNRHRKRAARFANFEEAKKLIEDNAPDNPGWDWKIVPADVRRWKHKDVSYQKSYARK